MLRNLILICLLLLIPSLANALGAKSLYAVHGDRSETVDGALQVLKTSKNVEARKRACWVLDHYKAPDIVVKEFGRRARALLGSNHHDVTHCISLVLLKRSDDIPYDADDIKAFSRGSRSKDLKTHGYSISGLARTRAKFQQIAKLVRPGRGSFLSATKVEILVETSDSVDEVLGRRGHPKFHDVVVFQAVRQFIKRKKVDVSNPKTFAEQRRKLTAELVQKPPSNDRAMWLSAITAMGPSPREVIALFDIAEGYFERLGLFLAMDDWTPKQSWAIPKIVAQLENEKPLIFQTLETLERISTKEYEPFIGYSLRRFAYEKKYGESVRRYLAKLEHGDIYVLEFMRQNAKFIGTPVEVHAVRYCSQNLLRTLSTYKYDPEDYGSTRLYGALLLTKSKCGVSLSNAEKAQLHAHYKTLDPKFAATETDIKNAQKLTGLTYKIERLGDRERLVAASLAQKTLNPVTKDLEPEYAERVFGGVLKNPSATQDQLLVALNELSQLRKWHDFDLIQNVVEQTHSKKLQRLAVKALNKENLTLTNGSREKLKPILLALLDSSPVSIAAFKIIGTHYRNDDDVKRRLRSRKIKNTTYRQEIKMFCDVVPLHAIAEISKTNSEGLKIRNLSNCPVSKGTISAFEKKLDDPRVGPEVVEFLLARGNKLQVSKAIGAATIKSRF